MGQATCKGGRETTEPLSEWRPRPPFHKQPRDQAVPNQSSSHPFLSAPHPSLGLSYYHSIYSWEVTSGQTAQRHNSGYRERTQGWLRTGLTPVVTKFMTFLGDKVPFGVLAANSQVPPLRTSEKASQTKPEKSRSGWQAQHLNPKHAFLIKQASPQPLVSWKHPLVQTWRLDWLRPEPVTRTPERWWAFPLAHWVHVPSSCPHLLKA